MSDHRLIVRTPAQARRRRIYIGVLVALALVAGWGLYTLGRLQASGVVWRFHTAQRPVPVDGANMQAEIRRLRVENRRLSRQLTALRRSTEVNQYAESALRDALEKLQSRVSQLKKELAFYRSIVSPKTGDSGVRVQSLTVVRAGKPHLYDLQFTLIRPMGYDGAIAGEVRISLRGVRDGESVQLTWSELALESADALAFSFEYYQRLGGVFRLPEGVQPTRIRLEIDPDADDVAVAHVHYRWSELVASSR